MKKIIYCLSLAVMLTACGGGTKTSETKQEAPKEVGTNQVEAPKKEEPKQVGDIITIYGVEGVVFEVTADGKHGKVMSVSKPEKSLNWNTAKAWCILLGQSWRLPGIEEWVVIFKNKAALNYALSANGHQKLDDSECYWALEEVDSDSAWSVFDGYPCPYEDKVNYFYVRAVSAF